MSFTIGLAQCGFPANENVLAQIESYAASAAQAGVQLLVFPENLMYPRELDAAELSALSEPLNGPFLRGIASIAQHYGLWIVGTFSERSPQGGRPYNTAFAIDDAGHVRGSYRKCHLYDAHEVRESDRMRAGDALCEPIVTPFCTLGLSICYDLRFCEVARLQALAGCNLLVIPAAWHDGPHKATHWQTLLRARAIENECFVAGVCRAGAHYVGRSMVVDPLGAILAEGPASSDESDNEALVIAQIDCNAVEQARSNMPLFNHRRSNLYRGI